MAPKRTLTSWLTNRYLLIIRNEENFAEKRTFSFNYAKIIVFGIFLSSIIFILSFYLITGILSTWLDPRANEADANRKIIELSAKVDSLAFEVSNKDKFILNLKDIIGQRVKQEEISFTTPKSIKRTIKKNSQLADTNRIDSTHSKN